MYKGPLAEVVAPHVATSDAAAANKERMAACVVTTQASRALDGGHFGEKAAICDPRAGGGLNPRLRKEQRGRSPVGQRTRAAAEVLAAVKNVCG